MKEIITFLMRHVPRPWLIRMSYLFNKVWPIILKGDKVECPICESHFKTFLPYGTVKRRDNVLCPRCLSLERHRLLWLFLHKKTTFFTEKTDLLHIAPEQCFYHRFGKMSNIKHITADLESPLAQVKMDIHEMPFEDESFDVVLCNHVLEHIPDDTQAMRELYRILKPGGTAILQIPQDLSLEKTFEDDSITSRKERARIFGQYDHVRVYGRDYFDKLRSIGFRVVEEDYTTKITPQDVERFCLAKGEIIPVCYKD